MRSQHQAAPHEGTPLLPTNPPAKAPLMPRLPGPHAYADDGGPPSDLFMLGPNRMKPGNRCRLFRPNEHFVKHLKVLLGRTMYSESALLVHSETSTGSQEGAVPIMSTAINPFQPLKISRRISGGYRPDVHSDVPCPFQPK